MCEWSVDSLIGYGAEQHGWRTDEEIADTAGTPERSV